MKIILKIILAITLAICLISGGCLLYYSAVTAGVEIDESKLDSATQTYSIFYDDGDTMRLTDQKVYEKISDLPPDLKNAFIAIEDKRFYSHNGIDFRAMLRALKNNIVGGKFKEGASTITQQLVKNTYLSGEKTINRKLKEIKLARLLEKKYSKEQILEKYLNKIYFGEGAYGINAASQTYFGKNVKDLTLAECATLAATIKAPSKYNPYGYYDKCMARKNIVLGEMLAQNFISEEEYVSSVSQKIILNERNSNDKNKTHLTDEILNEALELLNFSSTSDLNGYKIYTAINQNIQSIIPSASDYSLKNDYTIIITENSSGTIIGYRSSVGQLKRCPASSAKPWLVYAPAIENGIISEATKILDEKTNFGGYTPSNFGDKYYGYISAKTALAKSLNVPAVKLTETLGISEIHSYSKKLGIDFTNDDLSVGLGNLSGGITLSQIVSAYSPFINNGNYRKIRFISEITSPEGKRIFSRKNESKYVFSPSTCYIINDMLCETVQNGTAKKLSSLGFSVCAKTGTNGDKNGNTDAYCIAYTPEYTVAVWFGNADESKMPNSVGGGTYPAECTSDVFKNLYKNAKPSRFIAPDDVVNVKIDKTAYENDHKILLAAPNVDYFEFIFKKGTEPNTYAETEVKPAATIEKSEISYDNGEITIKIIANDNVYYTVSDNKNKVVLNSNGTETLTLKQLKPNSTYNFKILPYVISDGSKIYGEEIILPSVKTDGNAQPVKNWWNDE